MDADYYSRIEKDNQKSEDSGDQGDSERPSLSGLEGMDLAGHSSAPSTAGRRRVVLPSLRGGLRPLDAPSGCSSSLHALHPVWSDGGRVVGTPGQVHAVARLEGHLAALGVEHDAAGDAYSTWWYSGRCQLYRSPGPLPHAWGAKPSERSRSSAAY